MSTGAGVAVGSGVDVGLWFMSCVDVLFDAGLTAGPGEGDDTLTFDSSGQGGISFVPGTPVCVPGFVVWEDPGMNPWKYPDTGDRTTAMS